MLGMEVPIRTPTSFLFFAASGFAAYVSGESPALRWWAYSAFTIFMALGPVRWIEICVNEFQIKRLLPGRRRPAWDALGDTTTPAVMVGWEFGGCQMILFGLGSYLGVHGLLEL